MGYGEYLRELLRPLHVYDLSPESFSGGEIEALGAAMDDAFAALQRHFRESLVMTAEDDGLAAMESLFPFMATEADAQRRRKALSGFLQISGDSFTAKAMNECLGAIGTSCRAEAADGGEIAVSFPGVPGRPAPWSEKKRIIESILPCHLQPRYDFWWNTWGHTAQQRTIWGALKNGTFYDWQTAVYDG